MFHFAAYRLNWSYEFRPARHCVNSAGFPHSEIFGSKRACRSPKLIAACCVLRRLMKPRHPSIAVTGLCKRSFSRRLSYLLTFLPSFTFLHKTFLNFQRTKSVILLHHFFHRLLTPDSADHAKWWAQMDLNHRPRAYQARALTN